MTALAGVDNGWGTHANAAYRQAGFVDVASEAHARSAPAGTAGYDQIAIYAQQLREPLLGTGLVTAAELDRFVELVEGPDLVQQTPLMVATSGRRPTPERT